MPGANKGNFATIAIDRGRSAGSADAIAGGNVLHNRWGILVVLFTVRATMAFQFQSVAAVAPLLGEQFGVSIADIGVLIGLYFAPGIVFAYPGGAIGQKFGDKRTVLGALLLMLAGSALMAFAGTWNVQVAGRLVTGIGGVVLSVQLTKMLTDWFAGKEIATAMAILVNSWPAGIAVSLLTLPMGTYLLIVLDPIWVRWYIDCLILLTVPILASGWRYHGKPKLPITLGVGVISGIATGVAQIAGPPVALYWLGGALPAAVARANMFVLFAVLGIAACINYFIEGLYTKEVLALVVLLGIPFTVCFLPGALSFHRASEETYRRISYAMIAFAGIVSLPLFDRFFR